MEVRLVVTNEKASAKQVRLGSETVIGRSSECNLRIASGQVSRQHCIVRVEDSRVLVRDLGSANGTEIDGVTIPPEIDIPVAPGTTLVVGPLKFVFEFTPEPPRIAEGDDDLQSTTQDIPPIPVIGPPGVEDEDTKDYGPSLSRQRRLSQASGEPDSGQLDFSEDQPNSPVAVVGGNPGVPSEGSSMVSAEETVFDGDLAERARDVALRLADATHGLESGTDLLPEGEGADVPPGSVGGNLAPCDSPDEGDHAEEEPEEGVTDEAGGDRADTNRRHRGWKVLKFLQRGRKPAVSGSEDSSKPTPGRPAPGSPPTGDPTVPPVSGDDDAALQDFFKNFEP